MNKHWSEISEVWKQVGAPLRPSKEDLDFIRSAINSYYKKRKSIHAVILGVTPEYYSLAWPPGTELKAIDHTREMIHEIWPGPEGTAECSEWTNLSLRSSSVDIIICDGGLHLLSFPEGQKQLVIEMNRVLRPGGIVIFRLFLPPEHHQPLADVISRLNSGKIANLNELKLHLWAALQENKENGVKLHDVWQAVKSIEPDLHAFADKMNWPFEHLQVINTYQQSEKHYYLVDFDDVLELFTKSPGGFTVKSIEMPSYNLGERCPTVTFNKDSD